MTDHLMLIKPIRSFVHRTRKVSGNPHFEKLWTTYGLPNDGGILNFNQHFSQKGPLILEIGFGSGEQLIQQASHNLDHRFIGIEVYRKGIHKLLSAIEKYHLNNIRIFEGDAVEIIAEHIPENSLDRIDILFPDPWPKRRHHKRRLIQDSFIALLTKKLKSEGQLYLATDWLDYAKHMISVLENTSGLSNQSGINQFSRPRENLALTKFQKRGLTLGHTISHLSFKKCV